DPAHEMSQRQWGLLLERQGRTAEALDHYVEATRIHPDFRVAWEDAARVATQLGRTQDAEAFRKAATPPDPNSIPPFPPCAPPPPAAARDEGAGGELSASPGGRRDAAGPTNPRDETRAPPAPDRGGPTPGPPAPPAPPAVPPPATAAGGSGQLAADARAALV